MYEVEWLPSARTQFADAWRPLDATGRSELMNKVERLDQQLSDDPFVVGESRESSFKRVATSLPVVIS